MKNFEVIFDGKKFELTPHQYYSEFLLVPCWLYNSPCDICKMYEFEVNVIEKK